MQNFLLSLLLMLSIACSTTSERVNMTAGLDNVYISNGVEQNFLANVPQWMNYSSWASCSRESSIRYLNFNILHKSYGLKYPEMLHMQQMWNRKIYAYKRSGGQESLPLKDESYVFNNIYAKVIGGSYDFSAPKFNSISLIWIDEYMTSPEKMVKLIRSEQVLKGHPILISHCQTSYDLEALLQEYKLDDVGAKVIGAEMFSLYSAELEKGFQYIIDISQILPNKNITLYGKSNPNTIIGINQFKKVE